MSCPHTSKIYWKKQSWCNYSALISKHKNENSSAQSIHRDSLTSNMEHYIVLCVTILFNVVLSRNIFPQVIWNFIQKYTAQSFPINRRQEFSFFFFFFLLTHDSKGLRRHTFHPFSTFQQLARNIVLGSRSREYIGRHELNYQITESTKLHRDNNSQLCLLVLGTS